MVKIEGTRFNVRSKKTLRAPDQKLQTWNEDKFNLVAQKELIDKTRDAIYARQYGQFVPELSKEESKESINQQRKQNRKRQLKKKQQHVEESADEASENEEEKVNHEHQHICLSTFDQIYEHASK